MVNPAKRRASGQPGSCAHVSKLGNGVKPMERAAVGTAFFVSSLRQGEDGASAEPGLGQV